MEKCFVIQPFDKDRFDKRYRDIFKPAILNAGLEPYRVDEDISVKVPIEEIERNILESTLCFAEITLDNPNVWYELGYAFACGKDVVMVCSEERQGKFPFDIQHRHILTYRNSSKSDFELLESSITQKLKAYMHKTKTVRTLQSTPIADQQGLNSHEIAMLIILMENLFSTDESLSTWMLQDGMTKAGYNHLATSVAIRTLSRKGMIELVTMADHNNEPYTSCKITGPGEEWMLSNQDQFVFRNQQVNAGAENDELPF